MEIFDFILNIDRYLTNIITLFGGWIYFILFIIVFAETGLVITPFLPGDSLLFATGAIAGGGFLNIWIAFIVMLVAAILGDATNYWIGYHMGPKIFNNDQSKIFKRDHLDKTSHFYEKHGGKTIIISRFLPIVRTFAPFIAGVGKMHYGTFFLYNTVGALVWVTSLTFAGYFFGQLSFVKENFEYVILLIIAISLLPLLFEYMRKQFKLSSKSTTHANYKDIQTTFKEKHLND